MILAPLAGQPDPSGHECSSSASGFQLTAISYKVARTRSTTCWVANWAHDDRCRNGRAAYQVWCAKGTRRGHRQADSRSRRGADHRGSRRSGFRSLGWNGSVPTGTPSDIVAKLNAACQKALVNPALRQRFSEISVDPAPSTPEEFGAFIRSETDKWRVVITEAGISLK